MLLRLCGASLVGEEVSQIAVRGGEAGAHLQRLLVRALRLVELAQLLVQVGQLVQDYRVSRVQLDRLAVGRERLLRTTHRIEHSSLGAIGVCPARLDLRRILEADQRFAQLAALFLKIPEVQL